MPLPQTVLSCSYITRATLSNKYNIFNTFINVKHKQSLQNKLGKKCLAQLKSLKINMGGGGLINPRG